MSKNYTDCDIVLELLPLYIEQKVGEESGSFVESHLAQCQQCREIHEFMNADFSMRMESADADGQTSQTELKQTKRKQKRRHYVRTAIKIIILIAALIGYLCLMIGIVVYTFRYLTGV